MLSNYSTERLPISMWAEDDRPREKMQKKGRTALTDAELLAILLGSGNREETAVELARRILKSVNHNLNDLGKVSIHDLCKFKGMGEAKAITVLAALEIGRRRKESIPEKKVQVQCSKDAYDYIEPVMTDLHHEEFWVIFLNRNNRIIDRKNISIGGIAGTVADPKLIFKSALESLASGIIVCHNHPSGNTKPSEADIRLTHSLKNAGKLLEIEVLDHIIVAGHHYYSFADEGLI